MVMIRLQGWLSPSGQYYEGDQASKLDIPVPARTTPDHVWDADKEEWKQVLKTDEKKVEELVKARPLSEIEALVEALMDELKVDKSAVEARKQAILKVAARLE
jgi:hypothetical protein